MKYENKYFIGLIQKINNEMKIVNVFNKTQQFNINDSNIRLFSLFSYVPQLHFNLIVTAEDPLEPNEEMLSEVQSYITICKESDFSFFDTSLYAIQMLRGKIYTTCFLFLLTFNENSNKQFIESINEFIFAFMEWLKHNHNDTIWNNLTYVTCSIPETIYSTVVDLVKLIYLLDLKDVLNDNIKQMLMKVNIDFNTNCLFTLLKLNLKCFSNENDSKVILTQFESELNKIDINSIQSSYLLSNVFKIAFMEFHINPIKEILFNYSEHKLLKSQKLNTMIILLNCLNNLIIYSQSFNIPNLYESVLNFISDKDIIGIIFDDLREKLIENVTPIVIHYLNQPNISNEKVESVFNNIIKNFNCSQDEVIKSIDNLLDKVFQQCNSIPCAVTDKLIQQYFGEIEQNKIDSRLINLLYIVIVNTKSENVFNMLQNIIFKLTDEKLINKALETVVLLFNKQIFTSEEVIINKLNECIEAITDNSLIFQHFKLLDCLLSGDMTPNIKQMLKQNNKKKDLMKTLLNNLEFLLTSTYSSNENNNVNRSGKDLFDYASNLGIRLTLIFRLQKIFEYNLTQVKELLNDLWSLFMENKLKLNLKDVDKNVFSRELFKNIDTNLNEINIKKFLYKDILINEKRNVPSFVMFNNMLTVTKLLKEINTMNQKGIITNNIFQCDSPKDIEGFDFIWKVLRYSKNQNSLKHSASLLIDLLIGPINRNNKLLIENCKLYNDYFKTTFINNDSEIENTNNNESDNLIVDIIDLYFHSILDKTKIILHKENLTEIRFPKLQVQKETVMNVIINYSNQILSLQLNEGENIFDLKNYLSHYYLIPYKIFNLYYEGNVIDDNLQLKDIKTIQSTDNNNNNTYTIKIEKDESIINIFTLVLEQLLTKNITISEYLFSLLQRNDLSSKQLDNLIYLFSLCQKPNHLNDLINEYNINTNNEIWLDKNNSPQLLGYIYTLTYENILNKKPIENNTLKQTLLHLLENFTYINSNGIACSSSLNKLIQIINSISFDDNILQQAIPKIAFELLCKILQSHAYNDQIIKDIFTLITSRQTIIDINLIPNELLALIGNSQGKSYLIKEIIFQLRTNITYVQGNELFCLHFINFYLKQLSLPLQDDFENNINIDILSCTINAINDIINTTFTKLSDEFLYENNSFSPEAFTNNFITILFNNNLPSNKALQKLFFDYLIIITSLIKVNNTCQNIIISKSTKIVNKFMNIILGKITTSNQNEQEYLNWVPMNNYFYCYALIAIISSTNPIIYENVMKTIESIQQMAFDLNVKEMAYIEPKDNKLFCGLINQGATCYMNSLIQQFVMNKELCEDVILSKETKESLSNTQISIHHQLKLLFANLLFSNLKAVSTKPLTSITNDLTGQPIQTNVQMDVQEYFNLLLLHLESYFPKEKYNPFINHFHFKIQSNFICKDCPHKSSSEEVYNALNLKVKDQHTLESSIESFFKEEILSGQNKYYCETCQQKVTTTKQLKIKSLPKCLVIVLKRFDIFIDISVKINSFLSFEHKLDLNKYVINETSINDNATYTLGGIIIHKGSAQRGHYHSLIKNNSNDKWYKFNDSNVSEFNVNDINKEAFGERDDSPSAYVLFYYKDNDTYMNKIHTINDLPNDIKETIIESNKNNLIKEIFFNESFIEFCNMMILCNHIKMISRFTDVNFSSCYITPIKQDKLKHISNEVGIRSIDILKHLSQWKCIQKEESIDYLPLFKFYFKTFLLSIYTLNLNTLITCIRVIVGFLKVDIDICAYVLKLLTEPKLLRYVLVDNTNTKMHLPFRQIISCALKQITQYEPYKDIEHTFIKLLHRMALFNAKKRIVDNCEHVLALLYYYASIDKKCIDYLNYTLYTFDLLHLYLLKKYKNEEEFTYDLSVISFDKSYRNENDYKDILPYFRMNDNITVSKTSPEANMPIKENDTHLICLLMKLMKHNIEEKKHLLKDITFMTLIFNETYHNSAFIAIRDTINELPLSLNKKETALGVVGTLIEYFSSTKYKTHKKLIPLFNTLLLHIPKELDEKLNVVFLYMMFFVENADEAMKVVVHMSNLFYIVLKYHLKFNGVIKYVKSHVLQLKRKLDALPNGESCTKKDGVESVLDRDSYNEYKMLARKQLMDLIEENVEKDDVKITEVHTDYSFCEIPKGCDVEINKKIWNVVCQVGQIVYAKWKDNNYGIYNILSTEDIERIILNK